jgi:hypothetical protein
LDFGNLVQLKSMVKGGEEKVRVLPGATSQVKVRTMESHKHIDALGFEFSFP